MFRGSRFKRIDIKSKKQFNIYRSGEHTISKATINRTTPNPLYKSYDRTDLGKMHTNNYIIETGGLKHLNKHTRRWGGLGGFLHAKISGYLGFPDIPEAIIRGLTSASDEATNAFMEETKRYVPRRYGALRVPSPFASINGASGTYGLTFSAYDYYKGTFNYADIQEHHKYDSYTTPDTGWHYGEKGILAAKPRIKEIVEKHILNSLFGG